jgi:hypothetical protein
VEELIVRPGSVAGGSRGLSEVSDGLTVAVERECGHARFAVILEEASLPTTLN